MESPYKVIKSTYEKFLEGKLQDTYDCVMLVMLEDELSVEDLEMQQDHIDYYSTVPIVNFAAAEPITKSANADAILAFLFKNLKERIDPRQPIITYPDDIERSAKEMIGAIE